MSSAHIFAGIDFPDGFDIRKEVLDELLRKINDAPIDTRQALKSFVASADPFQEKVIDAPENSIRLVAPAGSGKTQTVINRVLTQVKKGISPQRILVLTFDNSAAASLKSKLKEELARLAMQLEGLTIS